MRRAERRRAERAGQTPRTVLEIDYLLLVDDEARQGALRFAAKEGGPFLADQGAMKIPPLIDLPRLLSAAEHIVDDSDSDEDLRLLLAPGSSLGGARPKASVHDRDGHLLIAKFPNKGDEVNTVGWETVAPTLAKNAGIDVPEWRLESISEKPVLLSRRFDREAGARVPFLSAMSMLDARDNEAHSYLEFVDVLRQYCAAPKEDMRALWRRIVFSILISNTDDHLRNHGFLWTGSAAWRLTPAYDLNPVPTDIKPGVLTTTIDFEDGTASLREVIADEGRQPLVVDYEEACGMIGTSWEGVRKLVRKGRLTARSRSARHRGVAVSELKNYVQRSQVAAGDELDTP